MYVHQLFELPSEKTPATCGRCCIHQVWYWRSSQPQALQLMEGCGLDIEIQPGRRVAGIIHGRIRVGQT
jgi:hypothetical protein